jgi:hypothetical protein
MLKRLHEQGLVTHKRYQGVKLTRRGTREAVEMIRHHRLIELYLAKVVGMPWDKVHDEADALEHVISEDLESRLDELLADTRAAIAKYDRGSKAMFAGYHPVTGPARNRSQHYVNDRYRRDTDVLLAEHVESLVFGWTRHHGVVPLGALYIMPKAGMHGPEIGGCLTRWHIHQAGDGEFGSGAELPEMLHVWTVDMPGGPFAAEPDADYIRDL